MQPLSGEVPPAASTNWDRVLEALRPRLPSQQALDTWFRPLRPRQVDADLVEIEVPNLFFVDWIQEHYLTALTEATAEVLGGPPRLRFTVSPDLEEESRTGAPEERPARGNGTVVAVAPAPQRARTIFFPAEPRLNPRFTFSTFIVGTSNKLTHATCLAVAERPGTTYNPLFMYGGVGLGKTHLMHAIGHAVLERRPEARVLYISAERFMNEMIMAIQRGQQLAFREKYRNVDLLLIDDIQFLAGKDGTQEEFFYTFGALHEAHKQIVLTSDKPPREIKNLEERLVSRFTQGMVTDVKPPDLETRIAILKRRASLDGIALGNDVALLIASRVRANVRHLEGVLVRLGALTELGRTKISTALAEEVLRDYASAEEAMPTPARIAQLVAAHHALSMEALRSTRRTNNIALPRQIAMFLMRKRAHMSLTSIGEWFRRDHTTVLHACAKIERLSESDLRIRETLRRIEERLGEPE